MFEAAMESFFLKLTWQLQRQQFQITGQRLCYTKRSKKSTENMTLELEKNPDILASLGEAKKHQLLVGFALGN